MLFRVILLKFRPEVDITQLNLSVKQDLYNEEVCIM